MKGVLEGAKLGVTPRTVASGLTADDSMRFNDGILDPTTPGELTKKHVPDMVTVVPPRDIPDLVIGITSGAIDKTIVLGRL